MKAIILAAGQGVRLRPLTNDVPKCMVKYKGKCLIDYTLETLRSAGIKDIIIVKGYKAEALERSETKTYINSEFDRSNMVESLFKAEAEFNDDILVCYSDIIFSKNILTKVINCSDDFCVAIDKNWHKTWSMRMPDPLQDVETLKLNQDGFIVELGKKPKTIQEVEGQYMGLFKINAKTIDKVRKFYYSLDRNAIYDGKDFKNMFMTSFIQLIIDKLMPVKAVCITDPWMEFDCMQDLEVNIDITS